MAVTNKPIGGLFIGAVAVAAVAFGIAQILPKGEAPAADSAAETTATLESEIAMLRENVVNLSTQQARERAEAQAVLTLPAGAAFSPESRFTELEGQIAARTEVISSGVEGAADLEPAYGHDYEDGYFASILALDWQCAWLSTGVAAVEAGDDEGVAEAVRTLHGFTDTPYAESFPQYDAFLRWRVDPLLEGHAASARSYLESCPPETKVG